jgi:molecular chaperone GrpE
MSEQASEPPSMHQRDEGADAERESPGEEGSQGPERGADELRREAEENWDKYLRAAAELDNLRKRCARDVENARKYAVERLASAVLPARDSLEAGLAVENADLQTLLEGKRATLRLLQGAMEEAGIREVDPQGEPFDPSRHEAMGVRPSADVEPNTVLEVVQKGYRIHDRLLRPARVIVSQAPADPD